MVKALCCLINASGQASMLRKSIWWFLLLMLVPVETWENVFDMIVVYFVCKVLCQSSCMYCFAFVWIHNIQGCIVTFHTSNMFLFDPSWNTDQGVYHMCKHAGEIPYSSMKVDAVMIAPATDWSLERGLSMSTSVRTRKMVNYAWEG